MCLPKTTHILCAAPAGFYPSRLPRLNGAPKIQSQSQSQSQKAQLKPQLQLRP
jgi:hypothetical protein